ncbi:hypothetical protein ACI79D_02480 [Geodermatophilus sp. SYSU D00708]
MSDPDVRRVDAPDRSAADEAGVPNAVARPEYRRPQAFLVGPAARLVRGGLFGKNQDGYTGYYMEP